MHLFKTGPYNPASNFATKYEGVVALGKQENDVGIDLVRMREFAGNIGKTDQVVLKSFSKIFCSDLRRTTQTYGYLEANDFLAKKHSVVFDELFREVRFDITQLCSPGEYANGGSSVVRAKFVEAFICDDLLESRAEIKQRFKRLDALNYQSTENILIISHTFFLKLYIIYRAQKDLFEYPDKLKDLLNPNERIMSFCELTKLN
ncbi:MAG: hypothetical protein WCG01_03140 [bacterium]